MADNIEVYTQEDAVSVQADVGLVIKGDPGKDGVGIKSASQTVASSADGGLNRYTVELTDGRTSEIVVRNGNKGSAGVSPAVEVTKVSGGNEVSITDASGKKTFQVPDGGKGDKGDTGGYYMPVMDGTRLDEWRGSSSDMPSIVVGVDLRGDRGLPGIDGTPGAHGGYYMPKMNGTVLVEWVPKNDESESMPAIFVNTDLKGGFSPTIDVAKEDGVATITITDINGTKTLTIEDGEDKTTLAVEFANSVEECTDTSKVYVLPDGYIYAYMDVVSGKANITYEEQAGGYYYGNGSNPTGTFQTNTSCCGKRTNIIPVTPGDQFSYRGNGSNSCDSVVWLDSAMAYLSDEQHAATSSPVTVTAPANAAYVWFASFGYTSNTNNVTLQVEWVLCQAMQTTRSWGNTGHAFIPADYEDRIIALEEEVASFESGVSDVLAGKKIIYDGDSICQSDTDAGGAYAGIIALMTNGSCVNHATGGARLCANSERHSVVNNLSNLPTDGDLYCFQGGINDYWAGTALGTCTKGDYTGTLDTSTICGALERIFRYSLENFVGKPICFVITHKIQNTAYRANAAGHTFEDYRNAMVEVCQKYSIPYYDAFSESGLNGWNEMQNMVFLTANSAGEPDGIHPNAEGYRRYYVPQLLALFRRIMPV